MAAPTRILLIDDDQIDRAAVKRALARSNLAHEVAEAPDGRSGRELAIAQVFDCVLLDYRLPDVDTFELLAFLQSREGGAQTVLMLTGEDDQDVAFRLMRAGALDYLTKAELTPSGLARAIRYARARREFLGELDTARRDAEQKSLALDSLNRQKALLFSIIAHDLRNPFHAVLGLADLLGQAVATQDIGSIARRAGRIRDAAAQAYELMESLFAWAKIQMDTIEVSLADVGLTETAEEAMSAIAEAAADKGIVLSARCAAIHVVAQREMLVTVLRNLVSNAVKFTLPGGCVQIVAERHDGSITISVIDTGVGMPSGRVADLFSPDKRAATTGTAGERGSGFGLVICRDLLDRLGSALEVHSEIDHGTTFRFRLPEIPAV